MPRRISMLQRACILLAVVLAVSLVGYAVYYSHPTPERVVVRLLDNLHSGNIKGAERQCTGGLGLDTSSRRAKKLYKVMYGTMRYAIVDSSAEDTSAQVGITVTMVDMETQILRASYHMLNGSLAGGTTNKKKLYRQLAEQIEEDDTPTVTYSATVQLVRNEKGQWKVDSAQNPEFLIAITGGVGPF